MSLRESLVLQACCGVVSGALEQYVLGEVGAPASKHWRDV